MPDDREITPGNTHTLRAQAAALISQARSQITDLQHALATAPAGSALHARLAAVVAQTSAAIGILSHSLSTPGAALHQSDLLALEGTVFSGDAATLVSEATTQATSAAAAAQNVIVTAAATRQETQALAQDVFDHKLFDPYLRFASPEDEAAYRKREEEARRYVEQQLARQTPEGDLNAGGGMAGQMLDAHAHGAGASPDFLPRWKALTEKVERQHAAMRAAGQSTEEFDRHMADDVRRFLQAKGLSEAEIDRRLAGGTDPLRAVEPFVKDDADSRRLEKLATEKATATAMATPHSEAAGLPRVVASDDTSASPAPLTIDFGTMNAKLKAAGVQMTDALEPSGHGLAVRRSSGSMQIAAGGVEERTR